jgi:hypothetical protein
MPRGRKSLQLLCYCAAPTTFAGFIIRGDTRNYPIRLHLAVGEFRGLGASADDTGTHSLTGSQSRPFIFKDAQNVTAFPMGLTRSR